jgi:hypothetical protein
MPTTSIFAGLTSGGGVVGGAIVRLYLDRSQYDRNLASAEAKGRTSTQAMGSSFSKFKAIAGAAFLAVGIAAVKFAADAVRAFQESEQVLAQLRVAVDGSTEAYERQALALQDLTGFQDEEILKADTVLTRFKLTEDQIRALIPLVLDYARATGADAASAASNLGKALLGNTRALKTIGVDFKATGNRAQDLATIMTALEKRVGGAAEAFAKTSAGQVDVLAAQFDELKEQVGGALVPVLKDLIPFLIDIVKKVRPMLDLFGDVAGVVGGPLVTAFTLFISPLATAIRLLEKLEGIFPRLGESELHFARQVPELAAMEAELNRQLAEQEEKADRAATSTEDLALAHRKAAAAAREQRAAELELAGGLLGIITNVQRLRDAQREVQELRNKGKADTRAYRDAELEVLDAQLGLVGALTDYRKELKEAGLSHSDIIRKLITFAKEAGITRNEVFDLLGIVKGYNDELRKIPGTVSTTVITNYVDGTQTERREAQHGFHGVVRRPTQLMVGEAGPERVDVTPGVGSSRGSEPAPATGPRKKFFVQYRGQWHFFDTWRQLRAFLRVRVSDEGIQRLIDEGKIGRSWGTMTEEGPTGFDPFRKFMGFRKGQGETGGAAGGVAGGVGGAAGGSIDTSDPAIPIMRKQLAVLADISTHTQHTVAELRELVGDFPEHVNKAMTRAVMSR